MGSAKTKEKKPQNVKYKRVANILFSRELKVVLWYINIEDQQPQRMACSINLG